MVPLVQQYVVAQLRFDGRGCVAGQLNGVAGWLVGWSQTGDEAGLTCEGRGKGSLGGMKDSLAGDEGGVGLNKVGGTLEAGGVHGGGQAKVGVGMLELDLEVSPGFVRLGLLLGSPFLVVRSIVKWLVTYIKL
jgi:hypothetical protein